MYFIDRFKNLFSRKQINKSELKLPYRLAEGIFFEDSGNILTWGEKLSNIKRIDNPEILEKGKLLKWENKTCFGGHKLNLTIRIDKYYNSNGILEFIDLEEGKKDPRGAYKKHSSFFKKILGEPTETNTDIYDYKTDLWTIDDIQIIIGFAERYVDYEVFGIHKGKHFWSLNELTQK